MHGVYFPGGGPAALTCTNRAFDKLVPQITDLRGLIMQHTWFKTGGKQGPGESTPAELAQLAGVSRNSLRTDMLGPKARSALEPIVQIISAATEMMGNSAKAAFWFRYDPMIGMGTQTAMEHVAAGRGPQVLLYLRNVANGGYA